MAESKKRMRVTISILFVFIFMSLASATITTNPSSISLSTSNPSQLIEFIRGDNDTTPSLTLTIPGNMQNVVQLNFNTISFPSNRFATVSILSGATAGSYSGNIDYSIGSIPISVTIDAPQVNNTPSSPITVFPTSKIITVQQGKEKTQNILISVPATYPRPVTIEAVDFNPGTEPIRFDDINLGQISPGNSINIPIVFSGIDAQIGTYQTNLLFSLKDSQGSVILSPVSLTLHITAGVSPDTSDTFTTPPICSLSSTNLNLNQTYSLTCTNVVSNLEINIPSNEYYRGIKSELVSGVYKYDFIPLKFGNTFFVAEFRHLGASIFNPFRSEVRISTSGSSVPGTVLRFFFTPSLDNTGGNGNISIQLVDNKTGSLAQNSRIFIDATELTPINQNKDTFIFSFEPNKVYNLRGISEGYDDLLQDVNISPRDIKLTINPQSGDVNTIFSITTDPSDTIILINGLNQSNPFSAVLPAGVVHVEARKEGYISSYENISVDGYITANPSGGEIEKGKNLSITLTSEGSYTIRYMEELNSAENEVYLQGIGSQINFAPEKSGVYVLEVDGRNIATYQTETFKWKDKTLGLVNWGWGILIGVLFSVMVLIIYLKMNRDPGVENVTPYS